MENPLITKEYQEQMQHVNMTTTMGSQGRSSNPRMHYYPEFFKRYNIKTALDFGCGMGAFTNAVRNLGIEAEGYDPCIPQFNVMPEDTFEAVISNDVMEHVEPEMLADTLKMLSGKFTKAIYLNICCRPARQFLPDGRNAHLIIKPEEWWDEQIMTHMEDVVPAKQRYYTGQWNKNIHMIYERRSVYGD